MPKIDPSPSLVEDTLKATRLLADRRADVSAQAERMNACIERFESWVAAMPGRVQATISLAPPEPNHPEDPRDWALLVRITRDGKDWPVSWGYWEIGDQDAGVNWKPLRESSIDIKLYLIPELPKLIVEMAVQQERLKSKIDEVATGFQEFAGKVGMPTEGK